MKHQLMIATFIATATLASFPATVAQAQSVSHADRKFTEIAAEAGMAEVEMGRLAQTQGGSAEVKAFGERMVADHGKANAQLTSIAATKGIKTSGKLSSKDARELAKLQKLEATAFDREYVSSQLAAHKDAVKLFTKESKSGTDNDLKSFAGSTLPTLQDHLTMVTSLSKGMR